MKLMTLAAVPLLALAALLPAKADAQELSRSAREMLQATMGAYDHILAENPKDYQTLYRRAYGYYNQDSYGKALTDVNAAINCAPANDKTFRFDCFSLRAAIFERLGQYDHAVSNYKRALEITPKSYNMRYQLANCEFEAGNYAAAKTDYRALQSLNPRSQEALFGLARVAVKEGDAATASKLIKQGVDINPTAAVSYLRQAATLRMMGQNADAVDSYAVALTLDRNSMPVAMREMVELSRTDYNAVMAGLQKAIDKNPRSGTFYYIRGMLEMAHFHYLPAIKDFTVIVDGNLLNIPSIYTSLAECRYNLAQYDEALQMADYAIGSSKDNSDAYVMKSRIKAAQKAWKAALENAQKALDKSPEMATALMAKAQAEVGLKLYPEANVSMSEAITADKRRPAYYMDRAWLLSEYLKLPAQAPAFYQDVLKLGYPADQVVSLAGFADLFLGNTAEADAWIDNLTANVSDCDGEIAYYAACFWAQRGDSDKAFRYMEDSLKKGYASLHNWREAVDGGVNVGPIRSDSRFEELLSRYSNIFQ